MKKSGNIAGECSGTGVKGRFPAPLALLGGLIPSCIGTTPFWTWGGAFKLSEDVAPHPTAPPNILLRHRPGNKIYRWTILALTMLKRLGQVFGMNRLNTQERARILAALVEGNSLRATARMLGVAFNTVLKLLPEIGAACADYHDAYVRDVRARRIQCDEVWQFVGAKKKNTSAEQRRAGIGDAWTWTAIDADTKLCISYLVAGRDGGAAWDFMQDVASRVRGRVQLTTDGHKPYLEAVEGAFGLNVDFAMLQKIYGAPNEEDIRRYSPVRCIGCDMKSVLGNPDPAHVSTSFVERQNLTMRMSMRRFTRLTNAFSKKLANHRHAVALHFMYYNFCRVHPTLRVTPAMEAGLADHVWSLEELAGLLDRKASRRVA